jgi:hypothetical protein
MPIRCRHAVQLLCLGLIAWIPARAKATEENVKIDTRESAHDTKRAVNKADHRIEEAGCLASKAECARREHTDRLQEAKEFASDKIHEAADQAQAAQAQAEKPTK